MKCGLKTALYAQTSGTRLVTVARDTETDSGDPKNKKKEKVETGWRGQAPNVIAVVSLLLNLAVMIPFGYLNF